MHFFVRGTYVMCDRLQISAGRWFGLVGCRRTSETASVQARSQCFILGGWGVEWGEKHWLINPIGASQSLIQCVYLPSPKKVWAPFWHAQIILRWDTVRIEQVQGNGFDQRKQTRNFSPPQSIWTSLQSTSVRMATLQSRFPITTQPFSRKVIIIRALFSFFLWKAENNVLGLLPATAVMSMCHPQVGLL